MMAKIVAVHQQQHSPEEIVKVLFPRNPFKALNNLFSTHIKRMEKLSTLKMRF